MRLYTAHGAQWSTEAILIRARPPARAVLHEVVHAFQASSPDLFVTRTEILEETNARRRTLTIRITLGLVGVTLLVLFFAAFSVYALVSLTVRRRSREIGIRLALGAHAGSIAMTFYRASLRASVVGLLVALPLSLVALGPVRARLLAPNVNLVMAGALIAIVVIAVVVGASWWPIRRVTSTSPAAALRG
jgi:hypothetical protein